MLRKKRYQLVVANGIWLHKEQDGKLKGSRDSDQYKELKEAHIMNRITTEQK